MLKRLFSLFVSQKDLTKPNTESFPYWQNPGVQNQYIIPGVQIAGMIDDIRINRIPSQTDFNDSDIRAIPIVDTSKPDTEAIQALQTHTAELGRGASVSLIDMFKMSMDEVRKIGGNQ